MKIHNHLLKYVPLTEDDAKVHFDGLTGTDILAHKQVCSLLHWGEVSKKGLWHLLLAREYRDTSNDLTAIPGRPFDKHLWHSQTDLALFTLFSTVHN